MNFRGNKIGSIKTGWRRICKEAGVEDATPHTLKHTAITWAMKSGVPIAEAAAYFGTSIRTLEDNYLHLHPEFQKSTANAMRQAGKF